MHYEVVNLDPISVATDGPIEVGSRLKRFAWLCFFFGAVIACFEFSIGVPHLVWGAYYTNVIFWLGLAAGGTMLSVIFQIVAANWSAPVSRIAEANISFLPYAWFAWIVTYLGKEHLFPWARGPMPGKEAWMEPNFVYLRFAILLAVLFYLLTRFVRMNLRADIGMARDLANQGEGGAAAKQWNAWIYDRLLAGWKGHQTEIPCLQKKLNWNAPVLAALYAAIMSLFAFDTIMAMDAHWISNLFGAFYFMGNIYIGLAMLSLLSAYFGSVNPRGVGKIIGRQQRWDLGILTYGFTMIWGYFFFSQFLPQWYGNLPEETQWMILRTREFPWKGWGWMVFGMCFVVPFISLLSEDLKRTPLTFVPVYLIPFFGVWCERYIIVMPNVSPHVIPFGITEIGFFAMFLGLYLLCISNFLSKYPYAPIASPLGANHEAH